MSKTLKLFLGRGSQVPRPYTISLTVLDSSKPASGSDMNPSALDGQHEEYPRCSACLSGGERLNIVQKCTLKQFL